MVNRNPCFEKYQGGYLFPEVNKRKQKFLDQHPGATLKNLGIGDTTLPLPPCVVSSMQQKSLELGTLKGYSGYGPEQGSRPLRESIAGNLYRGNIHPDEVFISDGAKCDIGRLQLLFGSNITIAVQDPTYPIYTDTSLLLGQKGIVSLPCLPENDFFPDLTNLCGVDLLYFCSPNNPTGATATKEQLQYLINSARKLGTLIIFDSAYSAFIQDEEIPRSIYEIPGAHEVAIEVGSFSKMAGFTGVRLGWTIIPKQLQYSSGESVHADWTRTVQTTFNGASVIAQAGGIAALSPEGLDEMRQQVATYMKNTDKIKAFFKKEGYPVYGGTQIPYIWLQTPGKSSWEAFDYFMENYQIITVPGSGFGPSGEGFLRLSGFSL